MNQQSEKGKTKRRRSGLGNSINKLFNMDNPIMKALSVAADLLLINLFTVVLCIPVVTIGPAFIAMHDIVIRIVRGEEGYTVKPYFQAFAANFKQGALLSLVLVVAGAILYFDYLAALTYIPDLKVAIIAIGVIVLAIAFYAFALFARYENTFGGTMKNAAALAVGYFPRTLFMVVCSIGLWIVCIQFYQFGIPILLLFGFSLPCYVNVLMLKAVFRKLEGEEVEEEDENEDKNSKFLRKFYQKK